MEDRHTVGSRNRRYLTASKQEPLTPAGIVEVERSADDGWLLVKIGRARYVKRFNLSQAEAAQLIEHLREFLG